jgi:glutamate synthase domain-containing protein 2/glutamate synthase domain-containing protein 1/glutamate synthase domain-containing protein 3
MDWTRERDACGIGFVADAGGRPSRRILDAALEGLRRVRHRGAVDADARTGDGAGLLTPIPRPLAAWLASGLALDAPPGRLGIAMCFLDGRTGPDGVTAQAAARGIVDRACAREGIPVLAWRPVPVVPDALGERARALAPRIEQALVGRPAGEGGEEAERRCFRARKRVERAAREAGVRLYLCSLSFRTVTYKALCAADQLAAFYPDLSDPDFSAPFAVFHQRYSTNTLPAWERAQPFRLLCHNGEINTIQGNVNLMRAREADLGTNAPAPSELIRPVIDESGSDSAMLDNAIEVLVRGGRDVRHALAMMVPEAWEGFPDLPAPVRDFYRYHACLAEPWDGPAGLIFSDGLRVGAALDRNGLRPLRYAVCEDGFVACASEAGAVDTEGHGTVRRGKLGPGQMLCVDPGGGGVQEDAEIKSRLAETQPYGSWLREQLRPAGPGRAEPSVPEDLMARQVTFGFTKEEITVVLRPLATQGHEPTSSMGDDTAPAALANRPRPVTGYLKQRFAQVTNPPIDHLRERLVMSTRTVLGARAPILDEGPRAASLAELPTFILLPEALSALDPEVIDGTFNAAEGPAGLAAACRRIGDRAVALVRADAPILAVSDAAVGPDRAPVPSVLAVGAAHQALLRAGLRTRVGLIADAGDARDTHDVACLLGYGAEAVCPRTALETVTALCHEGRIGGDSPPAAEAVKRFRSAIEDGVLKIMSKMGISTVDAYRGAQIFEAIGLSPEVIEVCLAGTPSPVGGLSFVELGEDVLRRHVDGYGRGQAPTNPGFIKHRAGGEFHANNPDVVDALHSTVGVEQAKEGGSVTRITHEMREAHTLHRAVTGEGQPAYERFAALVEDRPPTAPRDLLDMVPAGPPVPRDEVEPAADIVRRFSTGAMSHGALSAEAHQTLAVALNLVGGKSNTGEGGEDRSRYRSQRNSGIKQVASGRFGVTPEYCAFAEELQIKMAQGSKPGEGGQLPGAKVSEEIARLRNTPPGVALISPPPHHDIYSIEDLAQLIFDLKQVNPDADVSVKLVSTVGVGTIAAGVIKGLAEVVHIAGAEGGTGASPLSSIKNAGLPWEIGLAETQEALAANGLRGRARIRIDGGLKTGRDVILAALLGADEFSFGTAALMAEGCIMVRTCHRDTCPVGIASQRPELRAKFAGTPEMVASYLLHVAEDVRGHLAALGLRTVDQAVGRTDLLRRRRRGGPRADALDLAPLLAPPRESRRFERTIPLQGIRSDLGDRLAADALPALAEGRIVELTYRIGNGDRAVGARLGGVVARAFGDRRPPGRVRVRFEGQAGQSFGAFLGAGVELDLTGEANDYVAKGMAGGSIVIRPPADDAGDPVLVGNTALYGATGGRLFVAGRAGERFAVRNSGAVAVVEGAGDHACEYMTGGAVVILGPVGHNMAAGMSGGEAYVYDPQDLVRSRVNPQLVEIRPPTAGQLPSLRRLIERHARATGSRRADELLSDWDRAAVRFVRVMAKAEVALIEGALEGTAGTGA